MKKTLIPLLVMGSALLTACDKPVATNANAPAVTNSTPTSATTVAPSAIVNKADAVAVVNGIYIAKTALDELEKEITQRSHGQSFPKEKLVEELIQRELLIQDATQKKLDKSPEFVAHLSDARNALLSQADLQNFIAANPITEADIKAEYDNKVAAEKGQEYKARHILVKTEAEAKKLIAELDKGADFAKLANKNSLDGKEAQNGGDLGWFAASQMVAPFSEAVEALEKGKYTKTPVQTQFGYHVILREDSRPVTPPPLDAVKEQLTPYLQRQKVQTMLENLRKQAKVEVLLPVEEKPKEVPPSVDKTATGQPVDVVVPEGSAPVPAEKTETPAVAPTEDVKK